MRNSRRPLRSSINTLRQAVRGTTLVSGAVIDVDVDNSPTGTVFCEDVFRMADGAFNILRAAHRPRSHR